MIYVMKLHKQQTDWEKQATVTVGYASKMTERSIDYNNLWRTVREYGTMKGTEEKVYL